MQNNLILLDFINQSLLHIINKPQEEEIINLLKQSFIYLDQISDINLINEFFSLILACLSKLYDINLIISDEFIDKIKNNSNRIIFTSILLANYGQNQENLQTLEFSSFISDSFKEIIPQLELQNNAPLIIFNNEIPLQFKDTFIINIFLLSEANTAETEKFSQYIFSNKNLSDLNLIKCSEKVIEAGLISLLPDSIYSDDQILMSFPIDHLSVLIQNMSNKVFLKFLPQIDEILCSDVDLTPSFLSAVLDKIVEFDVKFQYIDILLDSISPEKLTEQICDYLFRNQIELTQSFINDIESFPNPSSALRIIDDYNGVPVNILTESLLSVTDFEIYKRFFNSNIEIENDLFSSPEFWVHISSLSENQLFLSLINDFANLFMKFVKEENVFLIFNEMIFNKFPTTNNMNKFLVELLNNLNDSYTTRFYECNVILFSKVIETKIIPFPSFWKLFNFSFMKRNLVDYESNPLAMYAYEFSKSKEESFMYKSVTIQAGLDEVNNEALIDFIKSNDIDCFVNMNEQSLSLALSALIYASCTDKPKICGLTETNIIPFYAVVFNQSFSTWDFEISDTFISACKLLSNNQSQLQLVSINSILFALEKKHYDPCCFPTQSVLQIVKILIALFINNEYKGDKVTLIRTISNLSHQISYNKQLRLLLNQYGIEFFKRLILELNEFDQVDDIDLNLQVFEYNKIKRTIINNVESSSSNLLVLNSIKICEKFFKNPIIIKISNPENLNRVFKEFIDEKKWEDALYIGKYMKNNNFNNTLQQFSCEDIPYIIKKSLFDNISYELSEIYQIFSYILSDTQPENNNSLFELIFDTLMKDESIAINYFIILFEKIDKKQEINPELFLKYYSKQYNKYRDAFINAIDYMFTFNDKSFTFVRNNNENGVYQLSETCFSVTKYLIQQITETPWKYQLYVCLINLALSFPFLFTCNPQQLFDAVLLSLDYYSFYLSYDEQVTDEITNKIKSFILSLQFLNLLFYSVDLIEVFIPWLFEKICTFSPSQLIAIFYILISMLATPKLGEIFVSFSIKNNFLQTINEIYQKDIPDNLMTSLKSTIYIFLTNYYELLNNYSKTNLIYIDEISKVKNPFKKAFNNSSTILPIIIKIFDFNNSNLKIVNDLVEAVFTSKDFWFTHDITPSSESFNVNDFISHYKQLHKDNSNSSNLPEIPKFDNIHKESIIRYLSAQSNWIYEWFIENSHFTLLPHHHKILLNAIQDMNEINENSNQEEEETNNFFISEFSQKDLFKDLIDDILDFGDLSDDVYFLILSIAKKEVSISIFLDIIEEIASNHKNDIYSKKTINGLVKVLLMFTSLKKFNFYFKDTCLNDLISISLSSRYRSNMNFLFDFICLLIKIEKKLPQQVTTLIYYITYLDDEKLVSKALELSKKFENDELENVIGSINDDFENLPFWLIKSILEINPSLLEISHSKIIDFLYQYIYTNMSNDEKNKNTTVNLICFFFDYVAPKVIEGHEVEVFTSDEIDYFLSKTNNLLNFENSDFFMNHVSQDIIETNPLFWELYENNIDIINSIILEDPKKIFNWKFIVDHPELVNFQIRLSYFKNNMKKSFTNLPTLCISVDRNHIFRSSFSKLHKLSKTNLLRKIKINFIGETGIDYGGLTNEFFNLITQEIFNPENKIFKLTETHNYILNSNINEEETPIEYFRFAGKIIAFTVMQGHQVNAHLISSLCRQILHQNIKLEDIEDYDAELYKSFKNMLENDVDSYDLDFTINDSSKTIELKKDGDKIKLTNENKHEYVCLYADYLLRKSISKQIAAFCEGFNSLLPLEEICFFSYKELDLIICGINTIDVEDLRDNTVFQEPYDAYHPVVNMFFNVISKWNNDDLAKLILFITGSSKVPINGFSEYKSRKEPIKIAPGGDRHHFCVAHTCFNTIAIPFYENEEEMNEKLLISIQQCEFGLL